MKTVWLVVMMMSVLTGSLFADTVHMKNGSAYQGKIISQTPGVSYKLQTLNGDILVIKQEDVENIEYGPVQGSSGERKSEGFAVLFSLIFPGIGDFYVGNNEKGFLFMGLGAAGFGLMIKGASEIDGSTTGIGTLIYLGATVASCITAYKGAKNYGQASLFELNRERYALKVLPLSPSRNKQVLFSLNY